MSRPFLLAQLSDLHVGAEWAAADPVGRLTATVEAVRALPDRPDAVLVTGDVADHASAAEYEVARELLARIEAPLHVLPGNHDDRAALRRAFDLPGDGAEPVQYAADLGPLRLVVVDSTRPGEDGGELDAARLAWLDATLGADGDRPTVVALHHPPIVLGIPVWDAIGVPPDDRQALATVLAHHPEVQAVVGGHIHRAIAADLAGRVVLSAPSTYAQGKLEFGAEAIELVADEPPAYALHALVDGRLVWRVQQVV